MSRRTVSFSAPAAWLWLSLVCAGCGASTSVGGLPPGGGSSPAPIASGTPGPGQSPGSTPTPYASQTPVPATPTPGPLSVTPATLTFVVGGAPSSATFSAAEAGYSGSITATSANTNDVTVSPASARGPSATFTVTVAGPGQTLVNVADSHGNLAAVTVYVTQSNVSVNGRRR